MPSSSFTAPLAAAGAKSSAPGSLGGTVLLAAKRRGNSAQGERSGTLGHEHNDVSPEGAKEQGWNSQLLETFFLRRSAALASEIGRAL
jgi:hypothetical protein